MRVSWIAYLSVILAGLAGAQVSVVASAAYQDGRYATIIGVVHNTGTQPVQFVKLEGNIYDSAGRFLDSGYTYTMLDTLLPGEKSPFRISIEAPSFSKYDLQAQWRNASSLRREVQLVTHRISQDGRYWRVVGQVRNASSRPAEYVKIVLAAYDSSGRLTAVGYTYTRLDTLQGGQTGAFELSFEPLQPVTRYDLTVQSR